MFGKSHQGLTIRHILWSAFYINILLFLVAIWLSSSLLLASCILASVLIILLGNKHQQYVMTLDSSVEYVDDKRVSFIYYLKKSLLNKSERKAQEVEVVRNESITFSVYSVSSQKEYLMQSKHSSIVNEEQCVTTIGSSQCEKPCRLGMLNVGFYETIAYSEEGHPEFIWDNFAIATDDYSLLKKENSDFILKVPVNKEVRLCDESVEGLSFQQLFSLPSVKAIELYLDRSDSGYYSLMEFIGKKSNIYFHSTPSLLNFILRLREFINGKPIGIKIGIGVENEFRELCKAMKERNTFIDFISIIGNNGSANAKGDINKSLDYAIAFARETLKEFQIEREVKLIAVGKIKNGFELLKLLSIGANSCINHSKPECSSVLNYSDNRNEMLEYHRNVLQEALQLMKLSGFNNIENISPRRFFRQDSDERIRSFEEIYFKNTNYHTHDLVKKFMYN